MAYCFSIIIIAKNEAKQLAATLQALQGLTDNIIVLENGSTDDTVAIAKQWHAEVVTCNWIGYGPTKNLGANYAKYDWILSLDADEVIDEQLYSYLQAIQFCNTNTIYTLQRYMMWNNKVLQFGGSIETKTRLFHRQFAKWNSSLVHESLEFISTNFTMQKIPGKLLHYSYVDLADAIQKNKKYAELDAAKKFTNGKKYLLYAPKLRGWLEFLIVFIIQLGCLDGKYGWEYAISKQIYKQQKYAALQQKYSN